MFPIPKCRREPLGLCRVHNFGTCQKIRLCGANFRLQNVCCRKNRQKSALHSGIIFASPVVWHKPRSESFLNFYSQNTYQIRPGKMNASARRLLPAAMPERWPQVCRVKIMFILLLTYRFVSTSTNSIKCLVNWIPLRIRMRSTNIQPQPKSIHLIQ